MVKDTDPKINEEIVKLNAQIEIAKREREALIDERRPLNTVYKWTAPERIYEPKGRQWYVIVASIAMVVIVISALTNNFGLIFAVIAMILFIYALNTIPPRDVTHEITNKGIKTHGSLFTWNKIVNFWVMQRGNHTLINVDIAQTKANALPDRILMLKGDADLKKLVNYLIQHIEYLPSSEASTNFLTKFMHGTYQPLITYIEDNITTTKKDSDTPKEQKSEATPKKN